MSINDLPAIFYRFLNLYYLFLFLSAIIPFVYFRRLSLDFKIIGIYTIGVSLNEIISTVIGYYGIRNLFLTHWNIPFEFVVLAFFFHLQLRGFYPKWLIPSLIGIFVAFSVTNTFFIQGYAVFNSYPWVVSNLLLIVFSISYFSKVLIRLEEGDLLKSGAFLVVIGILFYAAGALFISIFSNYFLSNPKTYLKWSWTILWYVNNLFHILLIWGIFVKLKK